MHEQELGNKNPGIGDLMRELFTIYAAMVESCGGPSTHSSFLARLYDFRDRFLLNSDRIRAMDQQALRLSDFYEKYRDSIWTAAWKSGGVKVAVSPDWTTRAQIVDGRAVGSIALFSDTQLIPDPVALQVLLWVRGKTSLENMAEVVVSAQSMLCLRPLVDAALAIPPVIVYLPLYSWNYVTQQTRSLDETVGWRRISREGIDPSSEQNSQRHALAISRLKTHLVVCDILRAEPLISEPSIEWAYLKYVDVMRAEVKRHGYLSKEAAGALRALQKQEFRWLRNIPLDALPTVLKSQENQEFRERLEKEMKVLQDAERYDLNEATIRTAYALTKMVAEYNAGMAKLADQFLPKSRAMMAGGVIGGLIAGGASYLVPLLGYPYSEVAHQVVGSATAIGVVSGAGANWAKDKYEELEKRRIKRRTLFGVIARYHPPI